ncbi:hypothetical protein OnM2_024097 [Erysiphe neolycopersici]|uniref:Uncharacterized protein n=1 Tax=Erysiphe neolycopersici TaxID=212602 RepID=A0A420I1L1_9PEZI|nr:hypothetical protein OnM2_024097 [Erysiphe neolycopersici]
MSGQAPAICSSVLIIYKSLLPLAPQNCNFAGQANKDTDWFRQVDEFGR